MHKDEFIFQHAQGFADVETNQYVDINTGYMLGSTSKAFIAAAISILVDQGKLKWDTPLRSVIPFHHQVDAFISHRATIADALCHRTGLSRVDASWYGKNRELLLNSKKDLLDVVASLPVASDMRTSMLYNNHMYGVLGLVIEAVMDKGKHESWGSFLAEHILNPLGLTRTVSDYHDFPDRNFAFPYILDSSGRQHKDSIPPQSDKTALGAPGCICSTIPDMLKWAATVLRVAKSSSASNEPAPPFPLRNYRTALSPHMPISSHDTREKSYGFGWRRNTLPSSFTPNNPSGAKDHRGTQLLIFHGGNISGYNSKVWILPQSDFAIVTISNSTGLGDASDFAVKAIAQAALGFKPEKNFVHAARDSRKEKVDKLRELRRAYHDERMPNTPAPRKDDVLGVYVCEGYHLFIRIRLASDTDQLKMSVNDLDSQERDLWHYHHDVFGFMPSTLDALMLEYVEASAWFEFVVNFERDYTGKVARLTWKLEEGSDPLVFLKEK